MKRATNQEFEVWKAECIANAAKLDAAPKSVAQFWRKEWGIDATVTNSSSARSLSKGVGVSIQINENSNIDQIIDFAFRLQMMRSAETINDEIWMMGAQSIKQWLASNEMTWTQLLATMKAQVTL